MALRTTGHLLLGIVRIYSRKAKYLLADCNEAFLKIKMAFRPGQVDLPEEGREAQLNAITLPEVFHDFDAALPDFNELEYQQQLSLNQSRIEDITMKEELPNRSGIDFGIGMDDFGDAALDNLDDLEGLEQLREGSTSMASNLRRSRVDGSRLLEGDIAGGSGMDIDTPIPDDFGGNLDDHLFMDEIFNDEAMMREGEGLEGLKENEEEQKANGPEETVLLQNADESFALEPLDATVMQGLERHKTKRKRKLIVDEVKNITGDEMKAQMNDYSDTLVQIDLAPPTKKLMHLKETGTAEKFFYAPSHGDASASKRILKQFSSHLVLKCKEEDKQARAELLDELELARNADLLEEFEHPGPVGEDARLSAIPEEPRSNLVSPGEQLPDQVHEEEPVPSVSPIPAASDKSESPPPTEKKEKVKRERKSRPSQEHSRNTTLDDDEDEEDKEKRWTKRTHNVLETLRKKLKEQKEVTFTEMSKAATRKSAAQKFYTLLFLKKLQAIKFQQDEPFGEITIKKGKDLYKEL